MKEKTKQYLLVLAFLTLMTIILFLFHDFLTKYSNALMVLITFVYVVATIEICRANNKSATATKEQLLESRNQYEEAKRLEHRPYFSFILSDYCAEQPNQMIDIDLCQDDADEGRDYTYYIQIQNIGPATAKEIKCGCENGDEVFNVEHFPFETALSHEKKEFFINFCFPALKDQASRQLVVKLHLEFIDLLENKYSQEHTLFFMQLPEGLDLVHQWTSPPAIDK